MDAVQTRILDIARFYDLLYSLGEDIPESILDDLRKARKWYKRYSDKMKEERRKSKSGDSSKGASRGYIVVDDDEEAE